MQVTFRWMITKAMSRPNRGMIVDDLWWNWNQKTSCTLGKKHIGILENVRILVIHRSLLFVTKNNVTNKILHWFIFVMLLMFDDNIVLILMIEKGSMTKKKIEQPWGWLMFWWEEKDRWYWFRRWSHWWLFCKACVCWLLIGDKPLMTKNRLVTLANDYWSRVDLLVKYGITDHDATSTLVCWSINKTGKITGKSSW